MACQKNSCEPILFVGRDHVGSKHSSNIGARDPTSHTKATGTGADWYETPFQFGKVVRDLKDGTNEFKGF